MGNICWLGMGGGGTGTGSWIVLFLKFVHILCLFTQKPRVHLPTSPPSEGPWAQCNGKGSRFRTELWGSLGRGQTSGWVTEHAVYALWFHGFHKDACPQMHFPAHLKGRKIAPLEFSSVIQGFIICRVTLFYQSLLSHTKFLWVIAWKWSSKSYFQTLIFFLLLFKVREISVSFWKKKYCVFWAVGEWCHDLRTHFCSIKGFFYFF